MIKPATGLPIVMSLVGSLLAAATLFSGALPAVAGKQKLRGSFGANLLPFPNDAHEQATPMPGCIGGVEDIHWVAEKFTAPAAGTLHASMEGFAGDHDLYVVDGTEVLARSEQSQVPPDAPAEEDLKLRLKRAQEVLMVGCNWLGEPEVLVNYQFVLKK